MKIEYSILAALLGAAYLILKNYLPDFPVDENIILAFFVYVLGKLGVEVVGQPLRGLFNRLFK